jgi:serine/threonine protein phosphatase 1
MTIMGQTKPEGRLFAIGDIHGRSTALRALIEAIEPRPDDTLVILGDFIDCGPNSKDVVEHLIALSARCRLIPLLGNHEEMLLSALASGSEIKYWLNLGGQADAGFVLRRPDGPGSDPDRARPIHQRLPELLRDRDPHLRPCQL